MLSADWVRNFEIRVGSIEPQDQSTFGGNALCRAFAGKLANVGQNNISCTKPLFGRYLTIQRMDTYRWGSSGPLASFGLCEVVPALRNQQGMQNTVTLASVWLALWLSVVLSHG
jgi:hypothetical protein